MWNNTDASKGYRLSRDPAFMIRKGDWKLILSGQVDNDNIDMLYNLDEDPSEMNNLIGGNGDGASNEVIGKAEHLKALLVKYLKDADHPLAQEMQMRRTWRKTLFWSDTALDFRDTLADGTRTEYLFVGTPAQTVVTLTLEGEHASRYGLKLDSQHKLGDEGFSVVAVQYSGSDFIDASPVDLVIRLATGEKQKVVLKPPRNIKATARSVAADGLGFSGRLTFTLEAIAAPSKAPTTRVQTATSTENLAPTASPLAYSRCSGPSELGPNQRLYAKEEPSFICSSNGKYRFGVASDGDLSLWHEGNKVWSAGTCCMGSDAFVVMQKSDGNLVMRSYVEEDSEDERAKALWASGTVGKGGSILRIDDDGQTRVIATDGSILWIAGPSDPIPSPTNHDAPSPEDPETPIIPPDDGNVASVPASDFDETGALVFGGDVAGNAAPTKQGKNTSSLVIGAAIALVFCILAFIIAFVLVRQGMEQKQSEIPPPSSSSQPDIKDGRFPTGRRLESGIDTSIDTSSQNGPGRRSKNISDEFIEKITARQLQVRIHFKGSGNLFAKLSLLSIVYM